MFHTRFTCRCAALGCLWWALLAMPANAGDADISGVPDQEVLDEPLEEVIVSAPEPRYVAPTQRDRIGRIWAPVYINDKGPFRLVLDTGATHSAVMAPVAAALGIVPNQSSNVMLRAVTGSAVVPTIRIDSLVVGDVLLRGKRLPIIANALGGAEGVLGTEGFTDRLIYIDFNRDLIRIMRSHGERAEAGFITIPVKFLRGNLLSVDAYIGTVKVKAIIDTGGQATIANTAARDALFKKSTRQSPSVDQITGATEETQEGSGYAAPPIVIGDMQIRSSHITFGDMKIFEHWQLTREPAILIGMDVLGLLDTLIIDFKRAELQVRIRATR